MDDYKLKQELFYMVTLDSKYDFTRMEVVESILRLENERQILVSVFGRRFKSRIFDIAAGTKTGDDCVICGKPAEDHVICHNCMESILNSDYAKSKLKIKEKSKTGFSLNFKHFSINLNRKKIALGLLTVFLVVLLFFQLWILSLWHSIPDINPIQEAVVSSNELVPVSNETEAEAQLLLDFPEEQGYTVTFGRMDREYVGRFLIDKGQCCEEIEENLSDEERYDYFFSEDVYIFYISCQDDVSSRIGLAEVNSAGAIIVMGSFNDGRDTDKHYKYR